MTSSEEHLRLRSQGSQKKGRKPKVKTDVDKILEPKVPKEERKKTKDKNRRGSGKSS